MAQYNGVNYTLELAGKIAISQGVTRSGLNVISDTYECSSTASGSTIVLANLPQGAVIHGITLATDALGASTTVSLGDSTSATRYLAATSTVSAVSTNAILVDGLGYVIGTNAGDNLVLATIGGGAATGTIKTEIVYA